MADYLPKFKPGQTVTFTASTAVEGGQAVEITGDRRVGPAGAESTKYTGVAGHSALAEAKVTVHMPGQVQRIVASGTITAGDVVQAAADGKVATGSTAPIGKALTGGDDGDLVEIAD